MKKIIIFDFDGTLVDSLPVVIEIAEDIVGAEIELTNQEIEKLRNMHAREVIKYSGIPYWRIPRLLLRGKKLLSDRLKELKVFPGVKGVIKTLHKEGHIICVVSSNSEEIIRTVLRKEGIEQYISAVYGNVGLFTKSRVFKIVLRSLQASSDATIYIGDEVRDIEAAKKSGIPIISVTWGFNGSKILKKYQPDFLVSTPEELLKALQDK